MKLVIASDIHGSAIWCERLMEAVEEFAPDQLVLLGDLLYHGPRNPLPDGHDPARVAGLLNAWAPHIIAVRGNCDAEVDQMMLGFPCLADYAEIIDEGSHATTRLFLTHGHLWKPEDMPPVAQGSVVLSGHTHIKCDRREGALRFLNPGSVSLPKDGSRSYLTYCDGEFEFHELA